MNIHIEVIPETEMRPGVSGGDWFWDSAGDLQVRVSPLSDWRREILLAIHETVEAILCKFNGVPQADVDSFDIAYDQAHPIDLNAGDDPDAPYSREHCFATAVERILAAEMEVNWFEYDSELCIKYPGPSKKHHENG